MIPVGSDRIGVVVVGYGYWGPNIVRNVLERPELELLGLCELDTDRAARFRDRHADIPTVGDFEGVLADPDVRAICVATPPRTHHSLARRALLAGKHVLVEKPLATTTRDAEDLVTLAEERDLTLMPGHTFLYSPPVNTIQRLIASGDFGDVYFVTSSRMNLGIYQPDGVVCDLAPHDLSILLHWLDRRVVSVTASGRSIFQADVPETAFLSLTFEGGAAANVQVSWLAPRKVRQMVLVGSKRMVQYDDAAPDAPVRVYDRGLDVQLPAPATFGEHQLTYRTGDMVAPRIEVAEPLSLELEDFARVINTGSRPRSHARLGLEIVRVLDAAKLSLERGGEPVVIGPGGEFVARRIAHGHQAETTR
jgi:predicted dehydrogenase